MAIMAMMLVATDSWKTQNAASRLPSGILTPEFMNQTPAISRTTRINNDNKKMTFSDVQKTLLASPSLRPNSKVMNRCTADVTPPVSTENRPTMLPTTL